METIRYLKVPVKDLRIGMYVVELDRPWLGTPFLVQGFVVTSTRELEAITELCNFVYVDTGRSRRYHKPGEASIKAGSNALSKENLEKQLNVRITPYEDSAPFDEELKTAEVVFGDYQARVQHFYGAFKGKSAIDMREVRNSVSDVVGSLVRNPDACMLLGKLKRKSDYIYNHAIGSSLWAAALGRQLGLPKNILLNVAAGALMCDVGKIFIPDELLHKPGKLTPDEMRIARQHVNKGLHQLEQARGVDAITLQMVRTHHERHNGLGYPNGLAGKDIPVYGRIAGIVDCYDAMINDKPYCDGIAPGEAIRVLYNVRNVDFQAEMVEAFIQALGLYPAGSVVELSSGEVGVVVAEHRHRRLRPKLLLLLDGQKRTIPGKTYLDLFEVTHDSTGQHLDILRSLNPGEYGIYPDDLIV